MRVRPIGALAVFLLAACGGAPRLDPSILLVVLDTVRFDAVSANGVVAGTTPHLDALAAEGLRYTHAYANANWTLPSHVTLFTGLLPSEHGARHLRPRVSDEVVTLAERLRDAGYDTLGLSENPWISADTNCTQGFARFASLDPRIYPGMASIDVRDELASWLAHRQAGRPYFLFVNLMDAHAPYKIRPENPFVTPDIDHRPNLERVLHDASDYICRYVTPRDLAALRGLYLGGVARADERLGALLDQLRAAGAAEHLIVVVTADHGEHLGEHRLVNHEYGVHEELIHVPLVVHGVPGTRAGVIDAPVQLADVTPSILRWAGLPLLPAGSGAPLPTTLGSAPPPRWIVVENRDPGDDEPTDATGHAMQAMRRFWRRRCTPLDHIDGTARAVIQLPWKLVSVANHPPQLFDLGGDPGERRDLALRFPSVAGLFEAQLHHDVVAALAREPAGPAPVPVSTELVQRLRALGYVGDGAPGSN